MSLGTVRAALLSLFFLTGASGLVYQVAWRRSLTLVFGTTAFATSTVLAAFFAGLALGAFWLGRVADEGDQNPLLLYAGLTAGVGVFAFLMPLLFTGLDALYVAVERQFDPGFYLMSALRFLLSFGVLLVPTTLLGGTLPVMVRAFASRKDRLGWNVGNLYAADTFGAVVGALAAGFVLILVLGVNGSTYLAGALNLLVAAAVVLLDRTIRPASGRASVAGRDAPEGADRRESTPETETPDRLILAAVALAGACALGLEVVWTRALVFQLDNSTHAFATMLAVFLLGIAGGSFVVARFVDARRRRTALLGAVQLLVGVTAVLTLPVLEALSPAFELLVPSEVSVDAALPWKWLAVRVSESMMVMLVPTALMGMVLPVASTVYTGAMDTVGSALGDLYSANTVGGAFGALAAGFLLVPVLGLRGSVGVLAAASVAAGAVLLVAEPAFGRRHRWIAGVGAAVVGGAVLVPSLGNGQLVLTSYYERQEQEEVLWYEEGVGATVKVYRDRYGDRMLSVDGFPVAGTALAALEIQKGLAHLPLLLHERAEGTRVAIVGFGTGVTSREVLRYDVDEVVCVELVPAVVEAASWFSDVNEEILSRPEFRLVHGDGRNYLEGTGRTFDVISVDATSPKMAGNGSLYTLDFYRTALDRLAPDGLLTQWVPLHLLSDREMKMVVRTFAAAFPHVTGWFSPLRQHLLLVGSPREIVADYDAVERRLGSGGVRRSLAELEVHDPPDVLSWFVAGGSGLVEYAGEGRLNTDEHPYLEFLPALAYFAGDWYRVQNTASLLRARESPLPLVGGLEKAAGEPDSLRRAIERRFRATRHSIQGDLLRFLGERERAREAYRRALDVDPRVRNWLNAEYGSPRTGLPGG